MKTISLLLASILTLSIGVRIEAQQGRNTPGTTPCDLVSSGCAVAHSVNRRIVKAYTGNLFQLSRTGGGGGTQNIGFLRTGLVDTATVGTFCGAGSTGPNANGGANSCKYHIIYDQSGNGNDLTAVTADTPYTTDSNSLPTITFPGGSGGYFNNASPTSAPTGTVDKTILVVMSDLTRTSCCGWYGFCHAITDPNTKGTCYTLGIRGPDATYPNSHYNTLDVDLETDIAQATYLPNYSQNTYGGTVNGLGVVVGIGSYNNTSHVITMQVNGNTPQTITYTNLGNAAQVRFGAGGDASLLSGIFYEGFIMAKETTLADRDLLNANTLNFYNIARVPSCGNAGRQLTPTEILGSSNVVNAGGLRVLNVAYQGPLIQIQRVSDSHTTDIGAVGCDLDTATASSFCASTTCTVILVYNQMPYQAIQNLYNAGGWAIQYDFQSKFLDPSNGLTPPALTFSCLSSHPCISITNTTGLLQENGSAAGGGTALNVTPPLSMFMSASRTGNLSTGGGTIDGTVSGAQQDFPFLGYAYSTNTAFFCNAAYPNCQTGTASDNTFHSIMGVTTSSTTLSTYVDGSASASGSVTTSTSKIDGLALGAPNSTFNKFTGQLLEIVTTSNVVSSGLVTTLSSAAKAYWGY